MKLKTIAHIYTDFPEKFGIPRQSGLVPELIGRIIFTPEFKNPDFIRGIEDFSHLWLLWGFSLSAKENPKATVAPPRLGGRKRKGVFATRSPFRPNPLGLSCVKLKEIEFDKKDGCVLIVSGIDMLNGTPIYDIKPYLPYCDIQDDAVGGFAEKVKSHSLLVRFSDDCINKIEPKDRDAVISILSQDPRTAFIHDSSRVWGIYYRNYNIRFVVDDKTLTVCEVTIR